MFKLNFLKTHTKKKSEIQAFRIVGFFFWTTEHTKYVNGRHQACTVTPLYMTASSQPDVSIFHPKTVLFDTLSTVILGPVIDKVLTTRPAHTASADATKTCCSATGATAGKSPTLLTLQTHLQRIQFPWVRAVGASLVSVTQHHSNSHPKASSGLANKVGSSPHL